MFNTASGPIETILSGLSDVQRDAVTHRDGPLVVFSGAGSGKTRIITRRIAWLIETGVRPWEILAVTFTNKAAGEMRSRVEQLTIHGSRCLIATFHSACARWLREFAAELGFSSDFTIYDEDDSLAAIKSVLRELNIKTDAKGENRVIAADYRSAIGAIKTAGLFPDEGKQIGIQFGASSPTDIVQVYRRYQDYLAECNAMDFGDLIMNALLLLRKNERVRDTLQRRYRYILVDEYQDTNKSQAELLQLLSGAHGNIFVVGDDDQAIYSWRGASAANILNFEQAFSGARRVTMDQNYRCTRTIVDAASAMIANNRYRADKTLWTENQPGEKITYRLEVDGEVEAWWVARTIVEELRAFPYSEIAIFYRTNSQSRTIEDALRRERIPYRIFGTVRFYDRMEVKDLIAWLRLIVNPADDISLKRVINVPARGIGAVAIESLESEARTRAQPMLRTLEDMCRNGSDRKKAAKFSTFLTVLDSLRESIKGVALSEVVDRVLEATGYLEYVDKKFPDQARDKNENILELGAALVEFEKQEPEAGLGEWLASITLASSEGGDGAGVSLMTLHMAKGLEFDRVFVVGVEDGLLPHRSSLEDNTDIEEERRLLYVGMTRARKKLSLASAFKRRIYTTWSANRPSRFLSEIPSEFIEISSDAAHLAADAFVTYGTKSDPDSDSGPRYVFEDELSDDQVERPEVRIGDSVRHPTYGAGRVEEVMNEFGASKAVVDFGDVGRRKVSSHHLSRAR